MNHVACEIVFIHPGHRTSRVPALPRNVDEGEPIDLIGFRPRLVTRRTPPFRNYLTLVSRRCLSIFPSPASKTLSSKRNALSFSHPRIPSSGEREGREKKERKRGESTFINIRQKSGLQNQQLQRWLEERGHRVHEMPSFQREDNDRRENAHYILLINLTMRARRSRLTRVASVERADVQGRGCGNERERGERKREMRTRRRRRKTLVGCLLLVKHPRLLFSSADLVPIPKLRLSYMPIQTSP